MDPLSIENSACKNCGAYVAETGNFCNQCGQTLHIHRFTLAHFLHEMFHAFTHADKGLFLLIKDLAKQPGVVMYNYIVAGKRKTYFNPFIFIVLTGGFLLFSNAIFNPYINEPALNTIQKTEEVRTKKTKPASGRQYSERGKKLNIFMEKNSKIIMLASVPISSLVFFLFFKKKGIYYAEHLVAMCLLTGAAAIIMAVFMVPLLSLLKNTPYVVYPTILLLVSQLVYFGWAYRQFFTRMGQNTKWKPYVVSAANILIWSVLTAGASFIYLTWPMIFKS